MSGSGRSHRRSLATGLAIAGALVVAAAPLALAPSASAGGNRSVAAVAVAQGVRVSYVVPDYVVVSELFDAGGPVAQSLLDSAGRSIGFASLPYPGENAIFAPGVLGAATGQPIPFGYPFYARSDYPVTPESSLVDPTGSYALDTKAQRSDVAASARVAALPTAGDGAISAAEGTTNAHLDELAGKISVEATSVARGLSFGGGALTIGSVRSHSVAAYQQGEAAPAAHSQLEVVGAKVGDQAVTIDHDGVHVTGRTTAIPSAATPLDDVLKQAGISVRLVSAPSVAGGSSADILEVTSVQAFPGGGARGQFVWRFGGATTTIRLGAPVDQPVVEEAGPPGSDPQTTEAVNRGVAPIGPPSSLSTITTDGDSACCPGPHAAAGTAVNGTGGLGEDGTADPLTGQPTDEASPPRSVMVRTPRSTEEAVGLASLSEKPALRRLYRAVGIGSLVLVLASALWRGTTRRKGLQ